MTNFLEFLPFFLIHTQDNLWEFFKVNFFNSLQNPPEKWTLNESDMQSNGLIATYSFTSPIINVCVTDYVIHALTDHGIETYTHCIGHKLFNNVYEYGLGDDLYNSEVIE